MLEWIWTNSEKLASLATVAAAIGGVSALGFAAIQIASGRAVAREATAMEAYQSYLRSCVDRPHLGTWKMFSAWSAISDPARLEDQSSEKAESYLWLLSELLMTCELAMLSARDDAAWISTIRGQVALHEPALRSLWPAWRENYSPALGRVIDKAMAAQTETTSAQPQPSI